MKLQTRKILPSTGPATLDANGLTVLAVAATEDAVSVFTWDRGVVSESIVLSGVELPPSGYVPLLDSHDRSSVKAILGRADSFQVIGDQLHCRVVFDPTEEGRAAFERVKAGSLDAFSIGYRVLDSVWLDEGDSRTVNGRLFSGPLQLATKTELKELSAVAIPADPAARARSDETIQTRGQQDMIEENAEQRAAREERDRIREISFWCQHMETPELKEHLVESGVSAEQARKAILDAFVERKNAQPMPGYSPPDMWETPRFRSGRDASEKRRDAVIDGLCLRAGVRMDSPAPGANEYATMSFELLARECLQAAGVSCRGMSPTRVIKEALSSRAAVVADFGTLLAGVANKSMRLAYEQAPSTWKPWCKIGNARDFKTQYRVQLSEISDLDEVPEGTKYNHGEILDSKESFQVKTYGKIWAVTRQALVNDDMGALAGVSIAWGRSAARKVNSLIYALLMSNPTMADGVTLFHSNHGNIGTGGAISKTTLDGARHLMRTQKGPAGLATLNIQPRFLLVPASVETIADEQIASMSVDLVNPNPFFKKFDVIVEPLLDGTDLTDWYMIADPSSCDTAEVCYLNGQEYPTVEQRDGWNVDGLEIKARLDVGVAILDHRGFVFNEGE